MRIWFTEIGEPLPLETDARLHRYGLLTRTLARMGHDVTWWTSNFTHSRKTFVVPRDTEEVIEGVRLRILAGPGYQKNISLARFRHQAHFAKRFAESARNTTLPDLILSPIPTLETATEAVLFARERGVPILTDIRDEWPEEFVRLAPKPLQWGARLVLNPMFRKARYICKNADGILGISERQLGYGLKLAGREAGPLDGVFPLGYSPSRPDEAKLENARVWWRERGLRPDAFVVCFFGTIGKFFDLDTVIRAARTLEKEMDVQFVLCGEGSHLEAFRRLAGETKSVFFPGWVDGPKIAALMQVSRAGLAPYRADADVFSLPNKPFEYLSGGLPVLSSIRGELTRLLKEYDCGLTYRGDSVEELVSAVRRLHQNLGEAKAMGKRGRDLFESHFSTAIIHEKLEAHLRSVVRPSAPKS